MDVHLERVQRNVTVWGVGLVGGWGVQENVRSVALFVVNTITSVS